MGIALDIFRKRQYAEGFAEGYELGIADGRIQGQCAGRSSQFSEWYARGAADGMSQGIADENESARTKGRRQGWAIARAEVLFNSNASAQMQAYAQGYAQGLSSGQARGEVFGYIKGDTRKAAQKRMLNGKTGISIVSRLMRRASSFANLLHRIWLLAPFQSQNNGGYGTYSRNWFNIGILSVCWYSCSSLVH